MKSDIQFANVIRALGAVLILLCHYTEQSSNIILKILAQFFNIGVPIFIVLSGFLFGVREGGKAPVTWYIKRIKRIYIPYELFVIILAIITIICGGNVFTKDWVLLILGLQGVDVGVLGADQTWFITALLMCYLITPLIRLIVLKIQNSIQNILLYSLILMLIPMLLSFIPPAYIYTLFSPICWYALAYLLGYKFKDIRLTKKRALTAFFIICFVFTVRLVVKALLDGSILYDRITVSYTKAIAAFCIFYIAAFLFKSRSANRLTLWISKISFEIYLYHYMFTVGPIRLFGLTSSWAIDSILITIIVLLISAIMNKFSIEIVRMGSRLRKNIN